MGAVDYQLTQHEGSKNLPLTEALRVYDGSQKEMRIERCSVLKAEVQAPFIFHEEKWKRICRTDDVDDVTTSYCGTDSEPTAIADYRERIRLGARFTDTHFACVDAYTDG